MSTTTRIKLNKGDVLFNEGDVADCAYLVLNGQLEVITNQNGVNVTLGQVDPGELIGEMSVIDSENRTSSIVAKSACTLVSVKKNQIQERISQSDPIIQSLLSSYARRYRKSVMALKGENAPTIGQTGTFEIITAEKINLEFQLKQAIEKRQLDVSFQPILEVATDEIVGYEALIRWDHPERGFISPLEFIALAEETSLIVGLGEFVIDTACDAAKELIDKKVHKNPFISINVSPKQLSYPGLIEHIVQRVDSAGLPKGTLNIEITESAALIESEVKHVVDLCHQHGIKIALDNFGTGASNLTMMHKMKFDAINIDHSFTKNMQNDSRSRSMVNMIINMGFAMNADVMIGGIESEEMLDYVRELNCRYAQGYHIGKPQRLAEIISHTVLTKILSIAEDDTSVTQITLKQLEADADI